MREFVSVIIRRTIAYNFIVTSFIPDELFICSQQCRHIMLSNCAIEIPVSIHMPES
jgi:hypothetical protein